MWLAGDCPVCGSSGVGIMGCTTCTKAHQCKWRCACLSRRLREAERLQKHLGSGEDYCWDGWGA